MAPRLASLIENCMRHPRYLMAARERLPRPMVAGHFADPPDELVVSAGPIRLPVCAAAGHHGCRTPWVQDTMGARLFRVFLVENLKEPCEDAPLRDVLDRLEALCLLDSAEDWERYTGDA
jgi:hypothetical protein